MARIEDKYPLPEEERSMLVSSLLLSDVIFIAIGAVLASCREFVETGNILQAFAFGWLDDFASAWRLDIWVIVLPLAVVIITEAAYYLLFPRSESFKRSIVQTRQGINGELLRLPAPLLAGLLLLVGFSEELLFRYGLQGLLQDLLSRPFPATAASVAAIVITAVAFCLAHRRYRDIWTSGTVFIAGILLSTAFAITGNFLLVFVTHAIYDMADVAMERHRAMLDPDFFQGEAPCNAIEEELARRR